MKCFTYKTKYAYFTESAREMVGVEINNSKYCKKHYPIIVEQYMRSANLIHLYHLGPKSNAQMLLQDVS